VSSLPPAGAELEAANGRFMVYTLPVGAGNCQVVHCPEQNKIVMMDCGSKGRGNVGWTKEDATKYVRSLIDGGTEVAVTVSHPDGDHYNYIPEVFHNLRVNNLYLGLQLNKYDQNFQNWVANERKFYGMQVFEHSGFYASKTPESNLSCWRPDGHGGAQLDVASYVLGVNAGTTSNDASMVIAMTYDKFQTIFTGDMTAATERQILGAGPAVPLKSNVITGAHHGAETFGSNSPGWANATAPQFLMFSAGERFYHPRCTSVNNYLPHVLKYQALHIYHCGKDGAYEQRASTDGVAVTDDNGLIQVAANKDGSFQYNLAISGYAGAGMTTPLP
jgi:beta-lactamase superfamily II metal-dependent hydrolase